jgi:hypothetical protein
MIVDTLVIVATELAHDPLLKTITEAADEGTVAQMPTCALPSVQIADNEALCEVRCCIFVK